MNAIEVRDIRKTYRRYGRRRHFGTLKSALLSGRLLADLRPDEVLDALDGVTFDVAAGRTFGIIGRNGSGKSTLLKLIAGIGKPSSGSVRVEGRVSALIELGAGFHPEISGRENVFINGMMLGLSKREISARFDKIVAFAELQDFIEAPVKTYSSGMYMRLGFAVAINVDPDVLLVDEVLAVGDQAFTHKCLDKFAEFRRRGRTVLIVTHSLDMITRFCDDALWLDGGRVRIQGEPQHVIDAYLSEIARVEHEASSLAGAARSGDVEIVEVGLFGRDGLATTTVASGDPVTIEARVRAERPVPEVVFGFGVFNADGVRCCFVDTAAGGAPVEVAGQAAVRCALDRLDLVAGTYTLDFSARRADGTLYDDDHRCTFTVTAPFKEAGVFHPPHRWSFSGGVRTRDDRAAPDAAAPGRFPQP
jgi:ABC-type polysaccharide/polyol phosphate transport system ATPase subunit